MRDSVAMETEPLEIASVANGITLIDTGMAGQRELNAVYLIAAAEPALVETGPGADGPVVLRTLERLGISAGDLAHLVVTHIHVDHAGGAGALLDRFPRATVWVHEVGAPHLVDPTRLVASTARTYGPEQMRALYGETLPVPADRIRSIADGDRIGLGDRTLKVLHTPGHASHHVALLDEASGAMFTGEAIGSHLQWADCVRPALPPPEADVEVALTSIDRMRAAGPSILLTSHYGPVAPADRGFDRGAERIRAWSETVRRELSGRPTRDPDEILPVLVDQARAEYESDSGLPFDMGRYDAIGSIRMNAQGLARYWRKRWEREENQPSPQPS
jgi:glyoxylase-like metal-dependent hydrolase (beta-lactamase superfamily II)